MRGKWFEGILIWVVIVGIALVGLAIMLIYALDRQIIEQAAARNMRTEFLGAAGSVSRVIAKAGGIHNVQSLEEAFAYILELRSGIRRLSVYEILPHAGVLIYSSEFDGVPKELSASDLDEIQAGRTVTYFDSSTSDRAWLITAPILIDGRIIGALRGRFSLWKYDGLIRQEGQLAQDVGVGAVIFTSLAFLALVRIKVHRPIGELLRAMRRAEAGDLTSQAPFKGPADIREVSQQFNRMLDRVREAGLEKDRLLEEVRHFNETLQKRVTVATDELQQANLELVEARLAVERSQRLAALGELSAMVAHELGNPLNALSGHLQMLAHAEHSANRERHLAVIRSEVDRMVAIIRQVLDQTRVRLRSAPVNINSTIHEVLSLLSPGLPRQHVTLKTDLQVDLPPVAGDPRALHGLLFNLATNAVQAMPSGGELAIRTRAACSTALPGTVIVSEGALVNGTMVRLTIADTGKGIPPEHLSRIFEPFFTTRHDQGGTGLGLAICHRVVTDSGGRLAVKSEVGQGTEFTVDLPIWKEREIRRRP